VFFVKTKHDLSSGINHLTDGAQRRKKKTLHHSMHAISRINNLQ